MKSRPYNPPKRESDADFRALARTLAALDDPRQVAAFLRDLCTPAELEALCDRWKVVPLIVAFMANDPATLPAGVRRLCACRRHTKSVLRCVQSLWERVHCDTRGQ